MKNRKLTFQNIAIFIIIIVTFMGNALFFATLNTDSLRQSVEAETELSASVYANHLMERISLEDILAQRFQGDESQLFQDVGASEETDVWVIAPDGAVYSKNGESASGNLFDGSEEFSAELVQQAEQDGVSILWQGKKSILFLRQSCCAVRPIYGGRLFLVVVNHCLSAQAIQRRQLSLMFMIDTVLVFTTIVLIANIIFNYRRLLIRLATTDELTCLANRKSFNTEFEEFMEQGEGQECSLFLLDIDLFKQINDNYGHAAGDHALSYLAQEIQSMVKENHGFAGRWGGDEFIGILPLSGIEAHKQLKKLCRTIADAHLEEGFRMTISAGVASADGDTNLGKISERADLALYHSKENGRNSATLYDLSMEVPEELTAKQADAPAAQRPAPEAQRTQTDSAAPKRSPVGEGGVKGSLRSRFAAYVREKLVQSSILGVTWMAPFVAGGGILIALAFLFDAASVDLSTLTVAERAAFGSITPLAATLKEVGGITFNFMLPVFAGFMAYGIAGEDAFMTGFVGGYMTINSNSGFVGAMIAGFAAGIISSEIQQFTKHLPRFIRRAAPIVIYPVFNLMLMQAISWFVITPISSALGTLFTGILDFIVVHSQIAAGALSATMMATDMGGIINKVAYTYGVSHILQGQSNIMASIMLGGMVPPIGIFLSMLLFPKKYTPKEHERSYSTLFMGLSFITEGALPFVFTDLFRVIPSCMAGSAIGGGLSVLFGCELPAPHGGIFVFPVMRHAVLYVIALLIGSLVTAALLGIWKKDAPPQQEEG